MSKSLCIDELCHFALKLEAIGDHPFYPMPVLATNASLAGSGDGGPSHRKITAVLVTTLLSVGLWLFSTCYLSQTANLFHVRNVILCIILFIYFDILVDLITL